MTALDDVRTSAFSEYRQRRDLRQARDPGLVADRGEAVGMNDVPTPPLSAYDDMSDRAPQAAARDRQPTPVAAEPV
ncbi:MAG: hypothetical protein IOD05_19060, partial [Rhodobacter sp.]|nr:hypothetical protein [Rhodobacter sp.]